MGRTWARCRQHIASLGSFRDQRPVGNSKRSPLMLVLENKSFVMSDTIPNHSTSTVSIGRPVRNRNGERILFFALVFGRRVLGDHIVGDHSTCITDIELAWEMVVISEFITTISESGPFMSYFRLEELVLHRI